MKMNALDENVSFVKNSRLVDAGMRCAALSLANAISQGGFISDLTYSDFMEDVDHLLNLRKVAEFSKFCMLLEVLDATDVDRYIPRRLPDKVRYFSLGRYAGMVFFDSVVQSLLGKSSLMTKEKFDVWCKFIDIKRLREDWTLYAEAAEEANPGSANVVRWEFSAEPEEPLPEELVEGISRTKNFYEPLTSNVSKRLVIHSHSRMPVEGDGSVGQLIQLEVGRSDEKLAADEEAPFDFFGLVLFGLRLRGLFAREMKLQKIGESTGKGWVNAEPGNDGLVPLEI